ncbi:MAG TPA: hypothetical protein VGI29_10545, partial [Candidatus Binataceae bacterium]
DTRPPTELVAAHQSDPNQLRTSLRSTLAILIGVFRQTRHLLCTSASSRAAGAGPARARFISMHLLHASALCLFCLARKARRERRFELRS